MEIGLSDKAKKETFTDLVVLHKKVLRRYLCYSCGYSFLMFDKFSYIYDFFVTEKNYIDCFKMPCETFVKWLFAQYTKVAGKERK
jgi:hypothetical protein